MLNDLSISENIGSNLVKRQGLLKPKYESTINLTVLSPKNTNCY